MLFSGTTFIYLFLPIVLLVYYGFLRWNRALQNGFLFLASLLFYAWGGPKFALLMMGSIVLNWAMGLLICHCKHRQGLCKTFLGLALGINLGILFLFKYLNYVGQVLRSTVGVDLGLPEITLPIGISFFTFQAISYVVDVYRGRGEVQRNPLYVGLYISFFPQLIAGPIVRYETIAYEIRYRKETWADVCEGFARFVRGLAKKVLLANHLSILADTAFGHQAPAQGSSVLFYWLGAVAYALQIFFDFSGYSDMAIGLGRMFGFRFLENFRYPYCADSVSEFWRRWHISLGSWFRDYLYIPLGGSRVSKGRLTLNLLVVWAATGIWHGANVTFLLWGLMYFLLLAGEKLLKLKTMEGQRWRLLKHCYTLLFVLLGWVLFRSESVGEALEYMGKLLGFADLPLWDGVFWESLRQNAVVLGISALLCTPLCEKLGEGAKGKPLWEILRALWLFVLFVLSVASLVSSQNNPFIYFNF